MKNTILFCITLITAGLYSQTTLAADEGIQVHGHWKFEIYNPDGSFDRKVEFDNALQSSGAEVLVSLLSRDKVVYLWNMHLGAGPDDPACVAGGSPASCSIWEVGQSSPSPSSIFSNLTVTNNTNKLTLQGSITTASGLTNPAIGSVQTLLQTCTLTNGICVNPDSEVGFTLKILASPVSLTAGQVVIIKVEISFS